MRTLQKVIAMTYFAVTLAATPLPAQAQEAPKVQQYVYVCLLYTSDAADE